jgi:phosphate butyryltransferase
MKAIHTFQEMYRLVAETNRTLCIAVVNPTDDATQKALKRVEQAHLAEVIRIQDKLPERAAEKAVALIRRGDANVLMKGLIGTDILLRTILNKVSGLLPEGGVLTHISVAEMKT